MTDKKADVPADDVPEKSEKASDKSTKKQAVVEEETDASDAESLVDAAPKGIRKWLRNKWVLIGGGALLLLILSGGAYFLFFTSEAPAITATATAVSADGQSTETPEASTENAVKKGLSEEEAAAGLVPIVERSEIALYYRLVPTFTIQLRSRPSRPRFLQVSVVIMTRNPEVMPMLERHSPRIKNDLLRLFSDFSAEQILSPEAQDRVRDDALTAVNGILQNYADGDKTKVAERVFFTTFVVQ